MLTRSPFTGSAGPILIDLVDLPDEEIERNYSQLKRDGDVLTGEAHVPALRGKAAYLYAMASALYDSQGRPVGAIETIRDVTARREAEEAVKRSEAHFRLLANVGQALSSTLDMPSLFRLIHEQISSVMYAGNMIIALHDEAAQEVEFAYSHNPDEIATGTRRPADLGATGYIIRNKETVFLHGDVAEQARRMGVEMLGSVPASWLGVPMVIGERVLGAIIVQHYTDPVAYDETHCDLLEAVASQAAIAVENARLYREAQREKLHFESVVLNSPTAIVVIDLQAHVPLLEPGGGEALRLHPGGSHRRYIDDLVARTETMQAQAAGLLRSRPRGER